MAALVIALAAFVIFGPVASDASAVMPPAKPHRMSEVQSLGLLDQRNTIAGARNPVATEDMGKPTDSWKGRVDAQGRPTAGSRAKEGQTFKTIDGNVELEEEPRPAKSTKKRRKRDKIRNIGNSDPLPVVEEERVL